MTAMCGQGSSARPPGAQLAISAVLALVLAALGGWFVQHVVARLDHGVDLSDSAYYIISYALHRDIAAQSTLAGWVWAGLSPFEGILANRYLSVAFLLVAFASLAQAARPRTAATGRDMAGLVFLLGFPMTGALAFYFYWLTDPSYNSMNMQFIAFGWAAFFMLRRSGMGAGPAVSTAHVVWAVAVGAVLACVALIKITSAALLGAAFVVIYFAAFWSSRRLRGLPVLAVAALAGMALPFVVVGVAGEGPNRVFSTMSEGVAAGRLIRPPSLDPFEQLRSYLREVIAAPLLRSWALPLAGVVIAVAMSERRSAALGLSWWMRVGLSAAATAGFAWLTLHVRTNEPLNIAMSAMMMLAFALALGGLLVTPAAERGNALSVWYAMIASLPIYAYGTGNSWQFQLIGSTGFAWVAVGVAVALSTGVRRLVLAIPCLGLLGLTFLNTATAIETQPYRLRAPLSALKTPASVGPFAETFLDSPAHAAFYNALAKVRPIVEGLPRRPYLIDLTGRTPMVTYQIGARAPRTPWLISGYPGSMAVFDAIVGRMSADERANAWIFQTSELATGHPDSILEKFGLKFPGDYVAVTTVPVDYMQFKGTLYAPRATICKGPAGDVVAHLCKGG